MIVSTYRPYFAPFPGFFSKALRSDVLVLLDTVQFPTGRTWLTRNRFKNDQGTLWLKVPVWRKGQGLQRIDQVRICHETRWAEKLLESLKTAYKRSPFLEDHLDFLEGVFFRKTEKLIHLNLEIIRYLMDQFRVPAKVRLLSDLGIFEREPRLSVDICKHLGAESFLVQRGATVHLDREAFRKAQISVESTRIRPPVYPQLWGDFLPNLSALDLLFNCGPKAHRFL